MLHDNILVPIIINYHVLYLLLEHKEGLETYKDLIKISFVYLLDRIRKLQL